MYTYNSYVYGLNFSVNKKLNKFLSDNDLEFRSKINGTDFECTFPYHGGQVAGDTVSVIFGHRFTDTDGNPGHVKEIFNYDKEKSKASYQQFAGAYILELDEFIKEAEKENWFNEKELAEYKATIEEIKEFIRNGEPDIYSVEESS
jgi:hypothetical protein